jgi:hypothetical protein
MILVDTGHEMCKITLPVSIELVKTLPATRLLRIHRWVYVVLAEYATNKTMNAVHSNYGVK